MLTLLQPLDGAILLWIQNTLRGALDPLVCFYTHLGDKGLLWIAACLLLLLWKPTRKAGLLGLFAMVLGFLVTNVTLKHLFARPRPWLDVPGLTALVNEPDPRDTPAPPSRRRWPGPRPSPSAGWGCAVWRWRQLWGCPGCMWGFTTPATCWRGV